MRLFVDRMLAPMKRSLFLETSFWSRLVDSADARKQRLTESFLDAATLQCRVLISPTVAAELSRTPAKDRRALLLDRLWAARPEVVTFGARPEEMALELLAAGRWSRSRFADMVHVAYTVLSGADALVTWDVHDLARERPRVVVHAFAVRRGLRAPLIGTPQEVAEWLGIRIR